jgi:hypothetical protein
MYWLEYLSERSDAGELDWAAIAVRGDRQPAASRAGNPIAASRYVIGISTFYDVIVPAPDVFVAEFEAAGSTRIKVEILRKRTSKAELFEYVVSARR